MQVTLRIISRAWQVIALAFLLAACSTNPTPPPITDANERAPIERTSPVEPVQEDTDAATTTLLAQANDAMAGDDQVTAIVYLERAIRLSPRDSELWILLSSAHLKDENLTAAEQHARKAIALSSTDPFLNQQAWLQLADVLQVKGQAAEARSIRREHRGIGG